MSCEQLAEIAFATQKLRDQGYALATVLAETDKLESSSKFTGAELDTIRIVVGQAFNGGSRFPYEVLQACKDKIRK